MPFKPLAITAGEPAGIGPDIILDIIQSPLDYPIVVIGDPDLFHARAQQLGLNIIIHHWKPQSLSDVLPAQELLVHPVKLRAPCHSGELDPNNAEYVIETLKIASQGCMDHSFAGIVTAPVHKANINEAGIKFSGHTEFFEQQTQSSKVVMMLATQGLKVALATTHIPLRDVADAITQEGLTEVIQILVNDLQNDFGIKAPRILVAGLNPHAGESGHIGKEDEDIIKPTLKLLRKKGFNLKGPLPADTLFTPKYLENTDAVLAMYHDQGLPVLKYRGFGQAANITLGLPIIRTSVDHGTALDLAGTGQANSGSLRTAIEYAIFMTKSRRSTP